MTAAKIMIVEDSTNVAEDARECLEDLGYEISAILASGEAAVESAGRDRPDAVLMDIRLAGRMDGIEAAERIHAEFDIPVLFLTAYSDRSLLDRAKEAGAFGYLVKPFDERELHAMLEMTLYKARVEKERRRMAEKLRESEAKLQQYSQNLEAMVADRTRELEKAQAELLAKERLAVLGHFAGSISHELRNPLAAIDSSAYYLNMISADADEKFKEHLVRIRNNVKKSTDIIESLLSLSRMEKPNTEKCNLADVVSMSLRSAGIPETVDVRLQFPEEDLFLDIDPAQIRMALKNIVGNAVQAMDGSGKLTLSIQPCGAGFQACQQRRTGKSAPQGKPGSVPQTDATGAIELTIADTGPGIAPENHEKVFEPFFSTKTHGIGFGMSITRMIIENHGGAIRAESEPGAGAVFVITLPHAGGGS